MSRKHIRARLIGDGPHGSWARLQIPFNVEDTYGTKGRVPVRAMFGRTEFRTSIFPNGDGTHYLMVNRDMQAAAGTGVNETVSITLWRDSVPDEPAVPRDLAAALAKNRAAGRTFAELPPSARREYVQWIESAKLEQTRAGRVTSAVKLLASGQRRPNV